MLHQLAPEITTVWVLQVSKVLQSGLTAKEKGNKMSDSFFCSVNVAGSYHPVYANPNRTDKGVRVGLLVNPY